MWSNHFSFYSFLFKKWKWIVASIQGTPRNNWRPSVASFFPRPRFIVYLGWGRQDTAYPQRSQAPLNHPWRPCHPLPYLNPVSVLDQSSHLQRKPLYLHKLLWSYYLTTSDIFFKSSTCPIFELLIHCFPVVPKLGWLVCFFSDFTLIFFFSPNQPLVVLVVKNLPSNAGDIRDMGLIPGSGRSPGGGNGNSVQYSCLENLMNRGICRLPHTGLQRVGHDWSDLARRQSQSWHWRDLRPFYSRVKGLSHAAWWGFWILRYFQRMPLSSVDPQVPHHHLSWALQSARLFSSEPG